MEYELVDYSRQQDMDSDMRGEINTKTHMIIGCGGIGFWLGILLAMMGGKDFIFIDGDKLDRTNLNRIPVPQGWVGTSKAIALRKVVRTLRPYIRAVCISKHATTDLIEKLVQGVYPVTVWDCTDNARFQKELFELCKRLPRTKYIKIGYEGYDIGVYNNYNIWIDSEYEPGYRTSKANAISSVMSAGFGALFSCFSKLEEKHINIRQEVNNETMVEQEQN